MTVREEEPEATRRCRYGTREGTVGSTRIGVELQTYDGKIAEILLAIIDEETSYRS